VQPRAVLAMGAIAARAVFGPKVRVTKDRGRQLETPFAEIGAVTIHPAAVLRAREQREEAMTALTEDLALISSRLGGR
jgi:uracil-DNA glycosylase